MVTYTMQHKANLWYTCTANVIILIEYIKLLHTFVFVCVHDLIHLGQ